MLWSPLHEENFNDPFPMYARLRKEDPVHRAQTGEWIISRYEDVKQVLKDPTCHTGNKLEWLKRGVKYLQNKDEDFTSIVNALNTFLLFKNPPDHVKLRRFIMRGWDIQNIEGHIEQSAQELLRPLTEMPAFDLVEHFARRLPLITIGKILGLPDKDYAYLKNLTLDMIKSLDLYLSVEDLVKINQASKQFLEYFTSILSQKDLPEGMIKRLIDANLEEKMLSDQEMISSCIFLFVAGEETTSSLISGSFYTLAQHPDILEHLRRAPDDIETIINEVLRFTPPVHILGRITTKDLQLRDQLIKKGSTLTLLLASANRDETQFESPDTFNPSRHPNPHLSFGGGSHYCMGDLLAKMEATFGIKALLKSFPSLHPTQEQIQWNNNHSIRSLKRLMVQI